MTPHRRLVFAIFLAAIAVPRCGLAQFSFDAVFGGSLNRVDRDTSAVESAAAPGASVSVEHLAFDEKFRLFYLFDGGTYSSAGDWGYLQHDGGARYRFSLGKEGRLFVGGSAALRTNGTSWASADFRGVGAFANLEQAVGPAMLRIGLSTDKRTFAGEPQLDHLETAAFGSASATFQTRTTVIGEVGTGWKRYDEGVSWTPVPELSTDIIDAQFAAGGTGQAPGSIGGGAGAAGQQGGFGQRDRALRLDRPFVVDQASGTGPTVARTVTVFGRVAQSLGDRLAVSLEASHRAVFGAVPTAVLTTPEMLIDDGVYDDPYASDATVWRAGIKRVFANGRDLDAGVSHWNKLYEATPALDSSGIPIAGQLRHDRIWRFESAWREPIAPGRTGPVELAAITGYTFMNSESTDGYYTYASHRLQLMLSVRY